MASAEFAILGDDLALLSLKVALQVDRKLGGKVVDQAAFTDFGNELSKVAGISEEPATASFLQANPTASEVLAKAVLETSNNQVSNLDELVSALTAILNKIRGIDAANQSDDDLSKMKQFCLSLHKSMMSQKLPSSFEGDHAFEGRLGIAR